LLNTDERRQWKTEMKSGLEFL